MPLLRQFDLLDLVQRFDAALNLRRLGRVRPEAIDEALLLSQHGLLPRESGLLIRLTNGALALVEIVVARVRDNLAGIDFARRQTIGIRADRYKAEVPTESGTIAFQWTGDNGFSATASAAITVE